MPSPMLHLRGFLLLAALFASAMPATAADVKLPGTPVGKYFAEYLGAYNAHDQALLAKFASERMVLNGMSAQEWAWLKKGESEAFGGLNVRAIERSEPNHLTVLVVTQAAERWFRMEVEITPDAPDRIHSIHYFPQAAPENAERSGMSDDEIIAEFKTYMDGFAARDLFSGVVLVAKDGKPIFSHAYGMADKSSHRRNTMESVFTLASMTKMFTAISVAQLVEQGKLRYDDKVGKFFPDYPNPQVRNQVTVGQLLTHTSGLGDFLRGRTDAMMKSGVKRAADYLPLFANEPLRFEPGTRWSYSNAGFVLAGMIVEKVSGETYFDYVRKHVFAPAGMLNSDPNEKRQVPALMVTPYGQPEGGKQDHREPVWRDLGSPAGGAFSTAPDLLRYAKALRENKLITHATFEEQVKPHSSFKTPRGTDYGYGLEIWANQHGRRVIGHGGGTVGVDTEFDLYIEQGYAVIVLSNYEGDTCKQIGGKLRSMILAQ